MGVKNEKIRSNVWTKLKKQTVISPNFTLVGQTNSFKASSVLGLLRCNKL